jgi:cell division protein FtsW (lipid II flippase)
MTNYLKRWNIQVWICYILLVFILNSMARIGLKGYDNIKCDCLILGSCIVGALIWLIQTRFWEKYAYWFYFLGCLVLLWAIYETIPYNNRLLLYLTFRIDVLAHLVLGLGLSRFLASNTTRDNRQMLIVIAFLAIPVFVIFDLGRLQELLLFGSYGMALYRGGFANWKYWVWLLPIGMAISTFLYSSTWIFIIFGIFGVFGSLWLLRQKQFKLLIISLLFGFLGIVATHKIATVLPSMPNVQMWAGIDTFSLDYKVYHNKLFRNILQNVGIYGEPNRQLLSPAVSHNFFTYVQATGWMGLMSLFLIYNWLLLRCLQLADRNTSNFIRHLGNCYIGLLLGQSVLSWLSVFNILPFSYFSLPLFSPSGWEMLMATVMLVILLKADKTDLKSTFY